MIFPEWIDEPFSRTVHVSLLDELTSVTIMGRIDRFSHDGFLMLCVFILDFLAKLIET